MDQFEDDLGEEFQESRYGESLEGNFLVASTALQDDVFAKTIVYICSHDKDGVIGVIINHPIGHSEIKASALKKSSIAMKKLPKKVPLLFGGPVASENLIVIAVTKEQDALSDKAVTIYTEVESFLKDFGEGLITNKFLTFKGVAAWDPMQLENEIEDNQWLIVPVDLDLIFSQKVKKKWEKVMKDIGVKDTSKLVAYSGNA
jgi:putative transcriptional regulator